ncbi:MAG: putative arabinose efflux permease, family [Marmoricola sp.]|nr:putative arabinose efflux permease, family [Marmoricola sp.]
MRFTTYAELARNPVVRRILLLGLLIRIPIWAAGVVLTLHVVTHLDRSYTAAGAVEFVYSAALAVSGPWRGRLLDRVGLRAALAPSLVVLAVCWSIAPWVGYWWLLPFVAVAGLFTIPSFSIVRQVLIGAVPEGQRTAVLSVDSVFVEFSFMIGPVLGVLAAVYLPTAIALLIFQLSMVVGGVVLWVANPPLHSEASSVDAAGQPEPAVRAWLSPAVVAILVIAATATIILTGEDLGTVAALRDLGHTAAIGWELALWGLGSAIGGIVYGALHRHPPAGILLVLLAASTVLVALSHGQAVFTVTLFISGLFCAPTITATIDDLSRTVPASVRGEAMGWHGSALTLGGAVGAPLVGWAIDHGGWQVGFEIAGFLGLAMALAGLTVQSVRGRGGPDRVESGSSGYGEACSQDLGASSSPASPVPASRPSPS